MTNPKKFFWSSILVAAILTGAIVLFNLFADIYGLFQREPKKNKVVYYDERMSKYLMAFNYIPQNFDGVWMGPSLSANINTRKIKKLDIYNLSVMGANITEEKTLMEKILEEENHIELAIICLNPYITQNHGLKTDELVDKIYYASFGSYGLFKEYLLKFIRHFNLMPNKYPKNEFDPFGCNNYDKLFAVDNVQEKIHQQVQRHENEPIRIDTTAVNELHQLDRDLINRGIKIIYYFHPIPYEIYHDKFEEYESYKKLILNSITVQNVIDFNDEKYSFLTKNYENYLDHGHLNEHGRKILLKYLQEKIDLAVKQFR